MPHECLVLDDSRIVRAVARNVLEGLGFSVSEAPTAEDALEQCRHAMPDMVLVDWNLPGIQGPDFIEAIRQGAKGEHPKLLLCSTESRADVIVAAMARGADAYMKKPFDRDGVAAQLKAFGLM